ncbi:sensor histidine kinase [Candidatus Nitrosotenuis cloacae]|uniref:sensor histidine kinase n=1 Tax=Candidatus Nitrosotenuis cloacae TaxID=1603555 RepID=UPI002282940A|nr:HAMP domain-containing sensor histidine kinase [Candidatus Nitrosotenuis cloacae]
MSQPAVDKISDINLIETMAAELNHDLSNPLMVFSNVLELIECDDFECTKQELKEHVKTMTVAANRLNIHIRTLAHFNSHSVRFKKDSVLKMIKKAVSHASISNSIQVHLPVEDVTIDMDAAQLETAIIILVTSAAQAMNNKGDIFLRLSECDEDVTLIVEDNGDGIPLELLPRLFEPTYLNRKIGPCLGLPACKRIIENHRGEITVRSTPFGTVFSLKLLKTIR